MYEFPVLFPAISNRESFVQTIQIADDETGDLITLTDNASPPNPLYAIYLEISPPRNRGGCGGAYASPYYYDYGISPLIMATLSNYITIIDVGTIQVQIPYTVMQTLRRTETYDVYLRLEDVANVDARQLLIGKLPVHFGGHGT